MGTLRNLRRHPHLAMAVDYLRHCGADDIVVTPKKSRLQIGWRCGAGRMSITVSRAASGDQQVLGTIAKQQVRARYRDAGVEVRA